MTQNEFLDVCADGNYLQVCEAIDSGVDPNKPGDINGNAMTPMFIAATSGNTDAVKALTERGADCAEGFIAATVSRKIDVIELLVKLGADVNTPDEGGHTALLMAVMMNMTDIAERLIELGADVNLKTDNENNPLTYAAMMACADRAGGRAEEVSPFLVGLLVEKGAEYFDAVTIALKTGNAKFAEYIFLAGADPNIKDEDGRTFVMYSVMTGGGILRTLLEYGADPNIADNNGRFPLTVAALDDEADKTIIETLLEFGADINAQDKRGLTALMWVSAGMDRGAGMLLPVLIRTGGFRAEGWKLWSAFTALYVAAKRESHLETIRLLIKEGADVNIIDRRGMNALMYALANGDDGIADILAEAGATINFEMT